MVILHFFEYEPFFYYFVFTKTLNMSNIIYICIYHPLFAHKKISKAIWDNYINTLKYGRRILW